MLVSECCFRPAIEGTEGDLAGVSCGRCMACKEMAVLVEEEVANAE